MRRRLRFLFMLSLLGLAAACAGPQIHSSPGTTTRVILIRHADRDAGGHLTAAGRARAEALIDAVADLGVTAIYSPDLERNLDTVRPLAKQLGIEITIEPGFSKLSAGAIAKTIVARNAGGVVLWVGNVSGNLPGNLQDIYRCLGGEGNGPLAYGQLYILTVPDRGSATVVKSSYGQ